MWLLISTLLVLSDVIPLSYTAPATGDTSQFRAKDKENAGGGVTLNGRKKVHGEGEKCPSEQVNYCKCRARGEGLDITCEKINSEQLHVSSLP